jgi:hypothetical protein
MMPPLTRALTTAAGALLLVGCTQGGPAPRLTATATITANPDNPFSAWVAVEADREVLAWLEYGEEGQWDHSTPPLLLQPGQPADQLVLGLHADTVTDLRLQARAGAHGWTVPIGSHQTDPLPEDWAGCEASSPEDLGSFSAAEATCTNGPPSPEGLAITCFDRQGRPFWSLTAPGESLFMMRALSDGDFAATSISSSVVMLFDRAGKLLGDINALDLEGQTRFVHNLVDPHALIELQEGPWAGALGLLTNTREHMDDGGEVTASGLVVYDRASGEVLYDWSLLGEDDGVLSEQQEALLGACLAENNCLHANDLLHGVDPDGRQHFSLNLNGSSLLIRVDVDSDAVAWHLGPGGDFELVEDLDAADPQPLGDEAWMYNPHGYEVQHREGSRTRMLLFDNGNDRPGEAADHSRVLEIEIDEATMQAAPVFTYGSENPDDPDWFFAGMTGDADMLPGRDSLMFIKGDNEVFIADVSYPEGQERWRLSCPAWQGGYRLAHYPSLYETTWWYDVER